MLLVKMVIKKLIKKIYKNLSVIGKSLTIHTECIYDDDVWQILKQKVLDKKLKIHTFFIMTPTNYDYLKIIFNLKISKKEMSKIMKERYKWLLNKKQRLELHIHFDLLNKMSGEEKGKLILESIVWFKENLGYYPSLFVPGWWNETDEKLLLLKYNLIPIKFNDFKFVHDYEL